MVAGTLVRVDPVRKQATIAGSASQKVTGGNFGEAVKSVSKKFWRFFPRRAVVLADARQTVTVEGVVSHARRAPMEEISEQELETVVSDGVWKLFDRERAGVAVILRSTNETLSITGAHVLDIRVDGHRVVDPIGFTGETLDVRYRITYADKEFVRAVRSAIEPYECEGIEESGSLLARLVQESGEGDDFLVASILPASTAVVRRSDELLSYIDACDWGSDSFARVIAEAFAVDTQTAERMLAHRYAGTASAGMLKKLDALLIPELATVVRACALQATGAPRQPVYIYSPKTLPAMLFVSRFARGFGLAGQVIHFNQQFISENFDFQLLYKEETAGHIAPTLLLAVVAYCYACTGGSALNKMANRRARWFS